MNTKLIAIAVATLVIAPVLAVIASRVTENMLPAKQTAGVAANSSAPQPTAAAPMAPPMPAPVPATAMMPQAGTPDPSAGQPMIDLSAVQPSAPPPPPIATPSGILPPYPGQVQGPSGGTIRLPDGETIG